MTTVKQGVLEVGGQDYRWRVFRRPTWIRGADGDHMLLGLAILVLPPEPSCRELLLEFDVDPTRHGDMPQHQRFHLPDRRLAEAVEGAITAGCDPNSRGKRFHHEAGALQPR